jgi:hypothetical protein
MLRGEIYRALSMTYPIPLSGVVKSRRYTEILNTTIQARHRVPTGCIHIRLSPDLSLPEESVIYTDVVRNTWLGNGSIDK